MKLCVMNPVLYEMSLENALEYLSNLGVNAIEIGTGGYPANTHLNPQEYLQNPAKTDELKALLSKHSMTISALAVHGNPVHPNKASAQKFHDNFMDTLRIAQLLEVYTVVTFSGCPGGSEASQNPNWVICNWPYEFGDVLSYQWEQILIPYWRKAASEAEKYNVRIALEMHSGFCVYNPETLMKLRSAVGEIIGANFDPSHLFWQQIEPAEAIKFLGKAIYHFHAKDIKIDKQNTAINGILSGNSKSYTTVGDGHNREVWRGIIDALKAVGYDGAISIEHEDDSLSPFAGLEKAVAFLKEIL
jgi:sugar phosphate isomerase/epimerase